jgi:hypothetical protein
VFKLIKKIKIVFLARVCFSSFLARKSASGIYYLFKYMDSKRDISESMDNSTKTSVASESVTPEKVVMDSFFVAPATDVVGELSAGAMPVVHDDSNITKFLSRPRLIHNFNWTVGNALHGSIDPWSAFLSLYEVQARTSYYSRLRGDLVVRVVVNGSPMHYGVLRICYRPHPMVSSLGDPVYNHAVATESTDQSTNLKIVMSQLSGFYVNPCLDSGGELRIPYMSPLPGLELGAKIFSKLGTLHMESFTILRHANGGTNAVSFELYAHMENVVIDVPTAIPQGYTMQEAANVVKKIIRSTAKATEIAAEWSPRVLSAIAMLGFSRPMLAENTSNVRAIPFQLANYDLSDTCETLSLSASAEHTLGGQELGVHGEDELVLATLAARQAFRLSASWTSAKARGSFLLGSVVTPNQTNVSTYTKATINTGSPFITGTHVCMLPCAFAAALAQYWRCTMVYKFTVVASPYHKGRLRIYNEPNPAGYALAPPFGLVNSVVLDLAETNTVTIEVPWTNVRDMAGFDALGVVNTYDNQPTFAVRASAASTTICNGVVVCEVMSALSGMADNTPVDVLLEISAKDMVLYSPQVPRVSGNVLAMDGAATPFSPQAYDLTGGDAISSLRQVMKRYVVEYTTAFTPPNGTSTTLSQAGKMVLPAYLPVPGYPLGNYASGALDATGATNEYANYTGLSFMTYVSTAFALARGSVRWKVNGFVRNNTGMAVAPMGISRNADALPATPSARRTWYEAYNSSLTGAGLALRSKNLMAWRDASRGLQLGGIMTNPGLSAHLDVNIPFVSAVRAFNPRSPLGQGIEGRDTMNVEVTAELSASTTSATNANSYADVEILTAAGEDYNVHCFVHAPAFLLAIPTH